MRFLSRRSVLAVLGGVAIFLVATPAMSAETSNSEFVIIREGDVFPDDLYAGAISVTVEGVIDGDLIAFAAEEVVINGEVKGSVIVASPRLVVNGGVQGSVRMVGNALTITGTIGRDVVAAVWSASLSATSDVEGDVLMWAWDAEAFGSIGRDLTGTQRNLAIAGKIDGDVDVSVGRLSVVDELDVGGDLGYRSDNEAAGLEMAEVAGVAVNKTPLPPNLRVRALTLLGRFMVILFLSISALTVAYGWPRRTGDAVAALKVSPLRRWFEGAIVLFAPLFAVGVTGLILGFAPAAAAFPLLAVLVPVILALTGVSFALGLVAGAPVMAWLGGAVFRRLELYGSIVVGSLAAGLVWYLPYVGWLVPVLVLPLGLGAWIATWRQPASTSSRRTVTELES